MQIALKATTFPAEGWATRTGLPAASLAGTAEPTGTAESAVSTVPAAAPPPDDPAPPEPDPDDELDPEDEPEQAARATRPPAPAAATT